MIQGTFKKSLFPIWRYWNTMGVFCVCVFDFIFLKIKKYQCYVLVFSICDLSPILNWCLLWALQSEENLTPCLEFICLVECVLIWPAIHLLQLLLEWKVIVWSWFSFCFICVNVIPYELPWIFFLTAKKHNHFFFQEDWKKSNNSYLEDDLNFFPHILLLHL